MIKRLVQFRQLATQRRAPGAEYVREVLQRLAYAVRRLVEDERALLAGQRLEPCPSRRAFRGQETLDAEAVGGETGDRQRRDRGARARDGHHPVAGGLRGRHQCITRVGDERRAGIRDQGDAVAGGQHRQDGRYPALLIVLVQRCQPRIQAHAAQQLRCVAGVLRGDHRDGGERVPGPGGKVAEIAYGGGNDVQRAAIRTGQHSHPLRYSPVAPAPGDRAPQRARVQRRDRGRSVTRPEPVFFRGTYHPTGPTHEPRHPQRRRRRHRRSPADGRAVAAADRP